MAVGGLTTASLLAEAGHPRPARPARETGRGYRRKEAARVVPSPRPADPADAAAGPDSSDCDHPRRRHGDRGGHLSSLLLLPLLLLLLTTIHRGSHASRHACRFGWRGCRGGW